MPSAVFMNSGCTDASVFHDAIGKASVFCPAPFGNDIAFSDNGAASTWEFCEMEVDSLVIVEGP